VGGKLDPGEATMLEGVFHLHEQEARQVMTPIPAVVLVDVSDDVETALRSCVSSGHTRLVVTEDRSTEQVRGTVHANSLIARYLELGPNASIESLVKNAVIVPETRPLDDLLADLQRERSSIAVVIDEYGRTAGIVTVEDIVEEVVGEIDDETDPTSRSVRELASGGWSVSGHMPISDLPDYGIELPADSDAYNSVGGLVLHELGRMPQRGDTLAVEGYRIRVESVRDNRIITVRIRPITEQV
jgi:CBS domain containing-hemolysin-like protein